MSDAAQRLDQPVEPALGSQGEGYNEHMSHTAAASQSQHAVVLPPVQKLGPGFWIGLLIALVVLAAVVVYGIHTRAKASDVLATATTAEGTPEVSVVHPAGGGASNQLALPGNTEAYVDTPIFARTSGYLQKWYFDIGAHVKQGQLMATIETPELDQQLDAAQASLRSAQAELDLANSTSARYQNLLKSNSVSKQETDVAMGGAETKKADLEGSQANVRRLQQLQSFEKVYAPFAGVVTARNTDIGDLITGGATSGTSAKQLFHLASIRELRVFVAVPETYASIVRSGGTAELTTDEYPGQTFTGIIARNASAIDPASRTLNVEVDVPNGDEKLLPGAYVTVHFKVPTASTTMTIPSNTLLFRAQGLQVGVVRNGKVELVPVKIAQDHGATVEVASGLSANDALVVNPPDSIANGEAVKVKGGSGK